MTKWAELKSLQRDVDGREWNVFLCSASGCVTGKLTLIERRSEVRLWRLFWFCDFSIELRRCPGRNYDSATCNIVADDIIGCAHVKFWLRLVILFAASRSLCMIAPNCNKLLLVWWAHNNLINRNLSIICFTFLVSLLALAHSLVVDVVRYRIRDPTQYLSHFWAISLRCAFCFSFDRAATIYDNPLHDCATSTNLTSTTSNEFFICELVWRFRLRKAFVAWRINNSWKQFGVCFDVESALWVPRMSLMFASLRIHFFSFFFAGVLCVVRLDGSKW